MARQAKTLDLSEPAETEVSEHRERLAADLDAARQELKDAILTATRVSRRVRDLEWAIWRANQRQPVAP
jgi:hypothetical protein